MSHWKDVLCILAILLVYGLAGHLDDQADHTMDEALRSEAAGDCAFLAIEPPDTHAVPAGFERIGIPCTWPAEAPPDHRPRLSLAPLTAARASEGDAHGER